MAKTSIEWADNTLNFYTWDCTRISPGCKNCYMMTMAASFNRPLVGKPQWRGANVYKELRALKPGAVVFVNSMSDTYHENVPVAWIHAIHNAAAYLRPDVTFLLLTKRPERTLALSPYLAWPKNLWIGTSVESRDYLWRLDYLLQIPAAGHFVSAEPLLDSLTELKPYLYSTAWRKGLGWVILGGESGKVRRMFDHQWAREVRDLCLKAEIPFMFKQGSALRPGEDRLLDGREWNGSPFHLEKHESETPQTPVVVKTDLLSVFARARDEAALEHYQQRLPTLQVRYAVLRGELDALYLKKKQVSEKRLQIPLDEAIKEKAWELQPVENEITGIERDRLVREDRLRRDKAARSLNIAEGLALTAEDFVGRHVAVLGMTGMGKSNTVAVLCEELVKHIQMTIIDLEGEYWSLRDQHPFLVVGRGEHVDRVVGVADAEKLVSEMMESGRSVILDMYDFDTEERDEFLRRYLDRLFEIEGMKRKPHIVVMEEAAEFLNQRKKSSVSEAAIRLANRGRKRGIGLIMASQRPAALDKNVLNMSRILFLHGVQFPQDIGAYRGSLPKDFDAEGKAKNLRTGEAIVRRAGPDGKPQVQVFTIRRRQTADLGATPSLLQQQSPVLIPA